MLLRLDQTVCFQLEAGGRQRDSAIDALELIAHSRREGQHLVFGTRETLSRLAQDAGLSTRAQALFRKLHNEVTEMKGLVGHVNRDVMIVGRGTGGLQRIDRGDRVTIQMPLDMFSQISFAQASLLLGEHFEDCTFYEIVGRVYAKNNQLGSIAVRFQHQAGGGGSTYQHYRQIQNTESRFCLCIVDSDRRSPLGRIRGTARRVCQEDDANRPLSELIVLKYREVENLIPTRIFSEVSRGDPDRVPSVASLEALEGSPVSICRAYIDIKDGQTLADFLAEDPDTEDFQFWERALAGLLASGVGCQAECVEASRCLHDGNCNCDLIEGFGGNILSDSLQRMARLSEHKIWERLDSSLARRWEELGQLILSWGCGSSSYEVS